MHLIMQCNGRLIIRLIILHLIYVELNLTHLKVGCVYARPLELNENKVLHKIVRGKKKSDFLNFYHDILSKIRSACQESGLYQIEFDYWEKKNYFA